ncbi:unnamed protein product [Hermetia illucens]|uniref:Prolactin regulatory element-binding protein n=1 Tax=Hermetia illucens TaxID=343691 RepID=A0A7R8YVI7_HERIL|nr:prolactin regulatory element-binding protein [Hermetia illucens]CAD7085816.1 unnamed protein product [Hermetia illucens]
MAPTRRPNDGLLARVNFPLYAVEMLTSRHVLVAGGGGSSKTGVANGFEIYEIYHNGSRFVAEEVIRHETGPSVVMNFAVKNDGRRSFIVAGQEAHCQLYYVNPRVVSMTDGEEAGEKKTTGRTVRLSENGIRRRHNSVNNPSGVEEVKANGVAGDHNDVNANLKRIEFDIKPGDSIQTDFLTNEPIQRVVRISPDGKLMATGGTDGYIRIWSFPKMGKSSEIEAHSKELDDIDFSPDSKHLVSIAKDGQGIVWDVKSQQKLFQLSWNPPDGAKYLFKRCRYAVSEGKQNKSRLFTISNPLGKVGKQRGYLQQWNCEDGRLINCVGIDESLSSMTVRDDGRFIAVGTMFTGSVSIYIAFSLQRVLHIPNAHSMFVTGLVFLPITNQEGPPISSSSEAAVLSISVDNRVCIHSLQYRHTLPAWVAIVLIIVILFLAFMLCSYLGI